jgi:hypothetical protein
MESIFGFFESLFKNFTWGRLTFVAFTLLLAAGSVLIYEAYTGHLSLRKKLTLCPRTRLVSYILKGL